MGFIRPGTYGEIEVRELPGDRTAIVHGTNTYTFNANGFEILAAPPPPVEEPEPKTEDEPERDWTKDLRKR